MDFIDGERERDELSLISEIYGDIASEKWQKERQIQKEPIALKTIVRKPLQWMSISHD